ncbi:MAG: hypothetical protein KAI08_11565 [Bacteroidales bacterium]|nr:hypothetical protein [Bacteroidales bacterium]
MKTKWIAPKKSSLVPVIMAAVLGLASFSCSESPLPALQPEDPESVLSGIITEDFWVDQEGKTVYALEGSVILEFPEETVTEPTLFTVALFPLDHVEMDGYNMMNCGISLKSADRWLRFGKSVQLKLRYCTSDFKTSTKVNEENITIYKIIPNVYAYSIGECTVDITWKMINVCINECGFYVVGEN